MYDKVQAHWKKALQELAGRINTTPDEVERQRLKNIRAYMKDVVMAVVISHDKADEARFAAKNLDIKPRKLKQMLEKNSERKGFTERMQDAIDRYNSGASDTEAYFDELMQINADLTEEEARHVRMGLSEDELELFDILRKEQMTQAEEEAVKLAAKSLIPSLIEASPKVLVQDWYRDGQNTEKVRSTIEDVLDNTLPTSYDRRIYKEKCDATTAHVIELSKARKKWAA